MKTKEKVDDIIEVDNLLKEAIMRPSIPLGMLKRVQESIDKMQKDYETVLKLLGKIDKGRFGKYQYFRQKFRANIQDIKSDVEIVRIDIEKEASRKFIK